MNNNEQEDKSIIPQVLAALLGGAGLGYAGLHGGKYLNKLAHQEVGKKDFRDLMNQPLSSAIADRMSAAAIESGIEGAMKDQLKFKNKMNLWANPLWSLATSPHLRTVGAGLGGVGGAYAGEKWAEDQKHAMRNIAAVLGGLGGAKAGNQLSRELFGPRGMGSSMLNYGPGAVIGAGLGSSMEKYVDPFGEEK